MFRSLRYDPYDITFLTPAGKEIKTSVIHDFPAEIQNDPMIPSEKEWNWVDLSWYEGNIAYVAINSFNNQQVVADFDSLFPAIKKRAKKLILDIRNNGGGNTEYGAQILSRLTPDDTLIGSDWFTRTHNPAQMSWGIYTKPEDTIGNAENKVRYEIVNRKYFEKGGETIFSYAHERERLIVPTVILIGHQTFSAAEDFLVFCHNQKHIKLIGETTAGSTGNPISWNLPFGGHLNICSKKDTYPDGLEVVGLGIKPDIESHLTIEDFRKGKDTALETALGYLKNR